MRKLLLIAALLFAATSVMAGNVDLLTAQTKAANFPEIQGSPGSHDDLGPHRQVDP